METISFNKKSLHEFIFSEKYSNLLNIPITKHRAISQIRNPQINDNDIILVAKFKDNMTIGYIGILPDNVFIDKKKIKIGWLSCFWVDENYRSQGVASELFGIAMIAWEQRIFITNIVPSVESVYRKTKLFRPVKYKKGLRGYLRFNFSEILPPKKAAFKKLIFFFKIVDYILNLFMDLRFIFIRKYKLDTLKFEYLATFDSTLAEFISKHNKMYCNNRGIEELNWIIQYPWVIEGVKEDFNSSRYYFSSMSKRFVNQIVKITDQSNKITGLVLINIRDNWLNIPYIFSESDSINDISKFVIKTMISLKLNMVTTFNDHLISSFKKLKLPFIFTKTIIRSYFISKKFESAEQLNFQDGDGDCAFY